MVLDWLTCIKHIYVIYIYMYIYGIQMFRKHVERYIHICVYENTYVQSPIFLGTVEIHQVVVVDVKHLG